MIEEFDSSLLISINEEVSFGIVLDMHGLESAVARPWTASYGHELFDTPWKKAGALFHSLASTQYFQDGNKRTAWVAAELLLNLLGQELKDLPDVNYETFALCVAVIPDWDADKAAEWYEENSMTVADRVDYSILCLGSRLDHPSPGVWTGIGVSIHSVSSATFPVRTQIDSITRIRWAEADLGSAPELEFKAYPANEEQEEAFRIVEVLRSNYEPLPIIPSGHEHHAGAMPVIYQYGLVLDVICEGQMLLEVSHQETVLRVIPIGILESPEAPEDLAIEALA